MLQRTTSTLLLTTLVACGESASGGSLRIVLEVTGGPHAGRYHAAAPVSACTGCASGSCPVGVRFADPDSGAELSSLQLVVAGDGRFYLGVLFGGFRSDGRRHEIETRAGRPGLGTGSAVVNRRGGTEIHVQGRTGDGVPLTARVRCSHAPSVSRSGD